MLGTERFGGDGGDECGVDATREADDHIGEPVLAHEVAGAEHERAPHLGLVRERRGDTHRGDDSAVDRHGRSRAEEHRQRDRRGARLGDVDLDVDHCEGLDELGGAGEERAIGADHHGIAVEHQLVLTAHEVHVGDGGIGLDGPRTQQCRSRLGLAGVVIVEQELGPGPAGPGEVVRAEVAREQGAEGCD